MLAVQQFFQVTNNNTAKALLSLPLRYRFQPGTYTYIYFIFSSPASAKRDLHGIRQLHRQREQKPRLPHHPLLQDQRDDRHEPDAPHADGQRPAALLQERRRRPAGHHGGVEDRVGQVRELWKSGSPPG